MSYYGQAQLLGPIMSRYERGEIDVGVLFSQELTVYALAALVVAGPLMGDWLTQCVLDWMEQDATLVSFEYSNRKACYTGDVLNFSGEVASVEQESGLVTLDLRITDREGDTVTPGRAVVRFPFD